MPWEGWVRREGEGKEERKEGGEGGEGEGEEEEEEEEISRPITYSWWLVNFYVFRSLREEVKDKERRRRKETNYFFLINSICEI
jgi:hypothetical protein